MSRLIVVSLAADCLRRVLKGCARERGGRKVLCLWLRHWSALERRRSQVAPVAFIVSCRRRRRRGLRRVSGELSCERVKSISACEESQVASRKSRVGRRLASSAGHARVSTNNTESGRPQDQCAAKFNCFKSLLLRHFIDRARARSREWTQERRQTRQEEVKLILFTCRVAMQAVIYRL